MVAMGGHRGAGGTSGPARLVPALPCPQIHAQLPRDTGLAGTVAHRSCVTHEEGVPSPAGVSGWQSLPAKQPGILPGNGNGQQRPLLVAAAVPAPHPGAGPG